MYLIQSGFFPHFACITDVSTHLSRGQQFMDYFSVNRVRNAKKGGLLSCEDEFLWCQWKFKTSQCACVPQSVSTSVNVLECPCIHSGWPVNPRSAWVIFSLKDKFMNSQLSWEAEWFSGFIAFFFYFPSWVRGGRLYINTESKPEGIRVNSAFSLMLILWCLEWLFFQNICKVMWSIYDYLQKVFFSLWLCWC